MQNTEAYNTVVTMFYFTVMSTHDYGPSIHFDQLFPVILTAVQETIGQISKTALRALPNEI